MTNALKRTGHLAALAMGFLACLIALSARLGAVELQGQFVQGGHAYGQVSPGTIVTFGERRVPVAADGRFMVGFDRDHPSTVAVTLSPPGGVRETVTLEIAPREYQIQRIDGVPPQFVSPPPDASARINTDREKKNAARRQITSESGFAEDFEWPLVGIVTGVYGSQRYYNQEPKPRRPHYGIDIAAPAGTPVVAPAAGKVTLADPDMYFEGGLIFLDHGGGMISAFLHLGEIAVAVGDRVEKGDRLAAVGSTGRSTGAHLDWRIFWLNQRIDPALLVGPMPETP
ncbi:MAG: M23 family metallopeptidase [Pseudomonadota bacterium]